MANQTLMRIDSFIKLQLYARCFPLLEPRRLKVEQGTAWEGGLAQGTAENRASQELQGWIWGPPFWELCSC